uniref:SHSP domain-containing protein n=1 Tax=Salix viminalis TaxID=40686 RepID=A0A6N2NAT2_SALVM
MINIFSPFPLHNPIKISIPTEKIKKFLPSLILIASFVSLFICFTRITNSQETMKVHPLPKKRNNVTIQFYDHRGDPLVSSSVGSHHKKLRRLPHIFSRVLELPFRSDAEVSVEENPDCFRFVAETDNNIGEVRAHTVEIYPGVTKIVIRPNGYLELSPLADLELDMWRFRLPETTRPELASAVLADGELIVTVPKGEEVEEEGNGNNNNGEFRGVNLFFSQHEIGQLGLPL